VSHRLAIDFGTTNSIVAHWQDGAIDILTLPGLSIGAASYPPLIPSLLYVQNGRTGPIVAGQAVRTRELDLKPDNRLFRNFKRGITTAAPPCRVLDGTPWTDRDAGRYFLSQVFSSLPYRADEIDQLVMTAPVASFENYRSWVGEAVESFVSDPAHVRLVDESTAAALGYAVTEPGALVLVFDFGGGSLDLSLVQLPESREKTGGFLGRIRDSGRSSAEVIAKAGRFWGGSDVDQWLLTETLRRLGLSREALGLDYAALLTRCEQAKIALSTQDSTELEFTAGGQRHTLTLTRADLEAVLKQNEFDAAIRHVVDSLMYTARQQGVFKEDIRYVLLVGGSSLMPNVQALLIGYFSETAVRAHKPFTAVVEGALQVAAGCGLDDYLVHSYGLRHLDADTNEHAYEEIIPAGTRYPTQKPLEITLSTSRPDQHGIEFVIGEIDSDTVSLVETSYEDGQVVFVARADQHTQQIASLNEDRPPVARLKSSGTPGQECVRAVFTIDEQRHLRLTVTHLKSGKKLLRDVVVAALR
jgi:molecular chaperone DnaK (HSP70)